MNFKKVVIIFGKWKIEQIVIFTHQAFSDSFSGIFDPISMQVNSICDFQIAADLQFTTEIGVDVNIPYDKAYLQGDYNYSVYDHSLF